MSPRAEIPYYCDKMGAKGLGKLLEGIYGISPQTIKPSNHLIAIGPKLEGNTLHIKALSFKWTAIL